MNNQWTTLQEAVVDFSRGTRIFIGLLFAGVLGVFTPILFLNVFGVWTNAFSAYGDHLFVATACVIGNLVGIWTRRIGWSVLGCLAIVVAIQFVFLVQAKPINDWWSAYPAFTRTVGGLGINGLFFAWYAKQSGLVAE